MIRIETEQRSEAWFQAKLGRIGASRFKDLMSGESTIGYKGLISDIAAEIKSGEMEETYTNADMERGIELEPEARAAYEDIFEVDVEETGLCIPDESNEFHEWVGVSPDGGMDGFTKLLEIKCPKKRTHWNYIKAEKLPNEYKWQVQGQLFVTNAEYCDFMSYHPSLKPFIIRVYPDFKMHKEIEERLRKTITLIKQEIKNYNDYDFLTN